MTEFKKHGMRIAIATTGPFRSFAYTIVAINGIYTLYLINKTINKIDPLIDHFVAEKMDNKKN
jgi:hypothetical protein